jgi:hypothetical protein
MKKTWKWGNRMGRKVSAHLFPRTDAFLIQIDNISTAID